MGEELWSYYNEHISRTCTDWCTSQEETAHGPASEYLSSTGDKEVVEEKTHANETPSCGGWCYKAEHLAVPTEARCSYGGCSGCPECSSLAEPQPEEHRKQDVANDKHTAADKD